MARIFIILFSFLLADALPAQSCFTLRYFGMTVHPFGDRQAQLEPHKLDPHGHFIMNVGGFAGYEKFVWEDLLSVKVMQGVFTDCSGGIAGFSHVGLRVFFLEGKRSRVWFGAGPTLYYRQDWNRFPDYVDSGFFHRMQTRHFGTVQ